MTNKTTTTTGPQVPGLGQAHKNMTGLNRFNCEHYFTLGVKFSSKLLYGFIQNKMWT